MSKAVSRQNSQEELGVVPKSSASLTLMMPPPGVAVGKTQSAGATAPSISIMLPASGAASSEKDRDRDEKEKDKDEGEGGTSAGTYIPVPIFNEEFLFIKQIAPFSLQHVYGRAVVAALSAADETNTA